MCNLAKTRLQLMSVITLMLLISCKPEPKASEDFDSLLNDGRLSQGHE